MTAAVLNDPALIGPRAGKVLQHYGRWRTCSPMLVGSAAPAL